MKDIKLPPREKFYVPPRKKPPEHGLVRFILALGTLIVFYIISQYLK